MLERGDELLSLCPSFELRRAPVVKNRFVRPQKRVQTAGALEKVVLNLSSAQLTEKRRDFFKILDFPEFLAKITPKYTLFLAPARRKKTQETRKTPRGGQNRAKTSLWGPQTPKKILGPHYHHFVEMPGCTIFGGHFFRETP